VIAAASAGASLLPASSARKCERHQRGTRGERGSPRVQTATEPRPAQLRLVEAGATKNINEVKESRLVAKTKVTLRANAVIKTGSKRRTSGAKGPENFVRQKILRRWAPARCPSLPASRLLTPSPPNRADLRSCGGCWSGGAPPASIREHAACRRLNPSRIKARLRPQPNRSRLGCRVAAVSDHCVTEHHLEFERQTLAFWVLRKPFQHSERTGIQWPPH